MAEIYRATALKQTLIVGMTPKGQWYPPPHSPDDQAEALAGMSGAVGMVDDVLKRLRRAFGIKREQVVLAGFSAGGVVALESMIQTPYPFAAVVCHSGVVLEPRRIPPCGHSTKVVLTHSKDDKLFKWEKRYLPSKRALIDQGYHLALIEHESGGHCIFKDDMVYIANLLAMILGYPSGWRHPMTDLL
ncbi:MAG: alpha/beta hydrolase [Minisyncoccia bacterium]